MKLRYRRLGRTGLKVSEISLGSWLTYGGYVGNQRAIDTIDRAYRLGVNFFDTANVYRQGEAERIVGQALARYPRSSYVLATKVRGPMGDGPNDQGLSRKHIVEQCEASLRRLGVEYVDLYYCHYPDADTPIEESLLAMDDLVRQGKALYAGVSNFGAGQIAEAAALRERHGLRPLAANQPLYNMFAREIEREVVPLCRSLGIGQVVYSPLAQGVLAGKYASLEQVPEASRAADEDGGRAVRSWLREEYLRKALRLGQAAEEWGLPLSGLALAWTLREGNVASAIVGASSPEQIEENVKASGIELSEEQLSRIERILSD